MGKLNLEIVTPERVLESREVDTVIAPGAEGEFGILPGHISFLSGIVPGELRFLDRGKWEHICVSTGFAEVSDDNVSILVDSAERAANIDLARAQAAMERSKKRLEEARDNKEIDFPRAEAALKRSVARIKVAKKIQ